MADPGFPVGGNVRNLTRRSPPWVRQWSSDKDHGKKFAFAKCQLTLGKIRIRRRAIHPITIKSDNCATLSKSVMAGNDLCAEPAESTGKPV